jgi:hypothetical protein
MDINATEQALSIEDEGITIEILDAKGDPAVDAAGQPVTITVAGSYSKKYRRAQEWQRQQLIALRGKKQTGEQALRMQSAFVARCTIRWSGFTRDQAELPFTVENAADLYDRLSFVQEQVEQGISDHVGFFAKRSTSSPTT